MRKSPTPDQSEIAGAPPPDRARGVRGRYDELPAHSPDKTGIVETVRSELLEYAKTHGVGQSAGDKIADINGRAVGLCRQVSSDGVLYYALPVVKGHVGPVNGSFGSISEDGGERFCNEGHAAKLLATADKFTARQPTARERHAAQIAEVKAQVAEDEKKQARTPERPKGRDRGGPSL